METIKSILQDIRPDFDFSESSNFIEDGMLDSFDIVSLVSELEAAFDIVIDGLDIVPENFISIEKIGKLVMKSGGKL
ncbi:MAG: acyl carrier protein [Firmicutes bacterium]|jgi:acyl carrier protein|nr:acyl carrier protein [Bacillota bacterium]NBI62567.1 acyl carrier protein [Clostridiales bacterium]